MQADRVVPVIRGSGEQRRVGSGYRVAGRFVLTAAHCVRGSGHRVWLPDGERAVRIVADGGPANIDLALLEITPAPGQAPVAGVPPTRCGRVDRGTPGRIGGCLAVGYPKHAARPEAPFTTGQVDGWIPAASGLADTAAGRTERFLMLKAEGAPPRPLPTSETELGQSPWAGMSGAAVFADGLLVGVVAEHHLPEGDGSLTVVPITWVERLPGGGRESLLQALDVGSTAELEVLNAGTPTLRNEDVHLLQQEVGVGAGRVEPASPGEFRDDLTRLLDGLEAWARSGRLPGYLPTGVDTATLSRTVTVRRGIRLGQAANLVSREAYHLPAEGTPHNGHTMAWPQAAEEHRRLMVLADPGLGKSWLIRSETRLKCRDALVRLRDGYSAGVVIPVPLRCDQLMAAAGHDLAEKAAEFLVDQGLLPIRSRAALASKVRGGEAVLLLDALDEITPAQEGPLRALVRKWADQAGDQAQCVITSRIAGYTGSPVPAATEVELQAFTPGDVRAVAAAWHLPPGVETRLLNQTRDSAIAAMARIPLFLALMCSLAASPSAEDLPRTRGQLLERVLRWFMTRSHRSPDHVTATALDNVSVAALLELMGPLAFTFATQPGGWTDLMPEDRLLAEIRAVGPAFTELGRSAAEVLRELSVRAGVLVPAGDPSGGRSPGYLFFHRAVAEYLVARHLATLPVPQWLAIVDEHRWFDPDWAEVTPMLAERLTPAAARRLIEHLAAAETDPFHHSLFTAAQAWGARPDADRLLPAGLAEDLAERLTALVSLHAHDGDLTPPLPAMAYLPQPVLARLVVLAGSPERAVRWEAVRGLAGREGPGVTEALVKLLEERDWIDSNRGWVDVGRFSLFGMIADRGETAITNALLGMASDSEGFIRQAALRGLVDREGPGVTEALLQLLNDPRTDVSVRTADALASRKGPGMTQALLGMASDLNWHARWQAAKALAGREGPEVTAALLRLANDQDQTVRRAAARGLRSQEGPEATQALLSLLRHADKDIGQEAAEALADQKGPDVVTQALLHLASDPNEIARRAAAGGLAGREGPGVTEALLRLTGDPDDYVRQLAVKALAGREGPGVTEALLLLANGSDRIVKAAAAEVLADREGPDVTEALLSMASSPDWTDRSAATEALAGREGPGVTEALLRLAGDPDLIVRHSVERALASRKASGVTEAVLSLVSNPDRNARQVAAEALAGRKGPGATQGLVRFVSDQDMDVRRFAARGLAARKGPGVTEALLLLASDRHEYVRAAAAEALADREGVDVTEALLRLASDRDEGVQRAALPALWSREKPGMPDALSLLSHPNWSVRCLGIKALEDRDGLHVTEALLHLASDPHEQVRQAAIKELAKRDGPGVTEALLKLLSDPEARMRQAAADALSDRNVTKALAEWTKENLQSGQVYLPEVIRLAKRLMIRNYAQVDSAEQQSLRAYFARLTELERGSAT